MEVGILVGVGEWDVRDLVRKIEAVLVRVGVTVGLVLDTKQFALVAVETSFVLFGSIRAACAVVDFVDFGERQKLYHVHYFPEFLFEFVVAELVLLLLLEGEGEFLVESAGDPRVGQRV